MKKLLFSLIGCTILFSACNHSAKKQGTDDGALPQTFKEVFKNDFYVGTAMDLPEILGTDTASDQLIVEQFNSITPENYMKPERIHPEKDRYDFTVADKFVAFGMKHHMKIIGHTLIWHNQLPDWFFKDSVGNMITKEELIKRMKDHISTVVGRYKGKVAGWDVVNEAINDDGTYRNSPFYQLLGPDFIKLAFQFAHEADPDAQLSYNDYSMTNPKKRAKVIEMIKMLQADSIPVFAVGMQGHFLMDTPSPEEVEQAIEDFSALGVKVMVTELDMSVLPFPTFGGGADVNMHSDYKVALNPYANGLPDSVQQKFDQRYIDFFKVFVKHHDVVDRVTFWGASDNQSWKNNWPIPGRTDYPLLFDRNYQPKAVVDSIFKLAANSEQ